MLFRKKWFILLMSLMLLSTQGTVFAVSNNAVTRIPNVGTAHEFQSGAIPLLIIEEGRAGEFRDLPHTFRLILSNAEWFPEGHSYEPQRIITDVITGGGINPVITQVIRINEQIVQITIETGGTGVNPAYWQIPLYSKTIQGGFATVSVAALDSALTSGTYPYAYVVGDRGDVFLNVELMTEREIIPEAGKIIRDSDGVVLRIEESEANAIGLLQVTIELRLSNAMWFQAGQRGLNAASMLAASSVSGNNNVEVTDIRRINDRLLGITLVSRNYNAVAATIDIPLYFEITGANEVSIDVEVNRASRTFIIADQPAEPEVPGTPAVAIVTFTIGQVGYRLNGQNIASDIAPYIQPTADGLGRIMVPVRFVSMALGADEVNWNPDLRLVTVIKGDDVLQLTIGSNILYRNGDALMMDALAEIRDIGDGLGRTMIPVAHLARALGVEYTWNPETRSVTFFAVIDTPSSSQ